MMVSPEFATGAVVFFFLLPNNMMVDLLLTCLSFDFCRLDCETTRFKADVDTCIISYTVPTFLQYRLGSHKS
jgi:hypothetical protein